MGLRSRARQAHVQFLELTDVSDEVLAQLYEVEVQAHVSPWDKDDIISLVSLPHNHCIGLYCDERLVGFALISVVAGEAELYTIGILPKYQGLGFGHQMLHSTLARAVELGAEACFLEVRVSNEVAIHLYDFYGFQIEGVRKNYYAATETTPAEDAYLMKADLTALPDVPQR